MPPFTRVNGVGLAAVISVMLMGAARADPGPRWLLVSDLHFDPLSRAARVAELTARPVSEWHSILARAGDEQSSYGSDCNFSLMASALSATRARLAAPPVVVVAGDLLPHHFRERFAAVAPPGADFEAFAEKTVAFLAMELDAAFPHAQFVLALGNNDSTCGDYCVEPGSPFLVHLAHAFAPLVNRGGHAPGFEAMFATGGLYAATLPAPGSPQVVVLDSVPWSVHHEGGAGPDLGRAELEALASTLAAAPAPPWRWFVAHVPPGFDAFTSAKHQAATGFLDEAAGARLRALLTSAAAKGAQMVTGHTHHASFELIGGGTQPTLPLVSLPSISPIFRNNPAFTTADVDLHTGTIRSMTTYLLPLDHPGAAWIEEPGCRQGAADAASLSAYQAELTRPQGTAATGYLGCSVAKSAAGAVPEKDWPWYVCADNSESAAGYCQCVAKLGLGASCR